MGLCLGFSFLSLIEMVYWFTYRMVRNGTQKATDIWKKRPLIMRCVHFKQPTNCPVFPRIRFGNWKRFGSRSSNSAHHAFSRQICSAWPTLLITKGQKPTSQIQSKLLVTMKVTIIELADIVLLINSCKWQGLLWSMFALSLNTLPDLVHFSTISLLPTSSMGAPLLL